MLCYVVSGSEADVPSIVQPLIQSAQQRRVARANIPCPLVFFFLRWRRSSKGKQQRRRCDASGHVSPHGLENVFVHGYLVLVKMSTPIHLGSSIQQVLALPTSGNTQLLLASQRKSSGEH